METASRLISSFFKSTCSFCLLFLIASGFQGCINRVDRVTVEGKLKGTPRSYIYVSKFDGDSLALIDSIKTSSRGYFKTKLNVDSPYFVTIGTSKKDSPIVLLVQPGDQIYVESDSPELKNYMVDGSIGSAQLIAFNKQFDRVKERLDSLKKVYLNYQNNPKIDSIQHRLDSLYQGIIDEHKEYVKDFVRGNTFSLTSILAVFQSYDSLHPVLDYSKDRHLFRLVDSSLHSVYSSNRMVNAYHNKLLGLDSLYERQNKRKSSFKEGDILPNVGYPLISNEPLYISGIWFKYIFIDFWGGWCDFCPKNNKELKAIYSEYSPKGFAVLSVSIGGNPDTLKAIATRDSITWYQACIPEKYGSKLLDTLHIYSIPSNFITDRWGNIKAVNVPRNRLRAKLKELLP